MRPKFVWVCGFLEVRRGIDIGLLAYVVEGRGICRRLVLQEVAGHGSILDVSLLVSDVEARCLRQRCRECGQYESRQHLQ